MPVGEPTELETAAVKVTACRSSEDICEEARVTVGAALPTVSVPGMFDTV
jgi:hypothetical protein